MESQGSIHSYELRIENIVAAVFNSFSKTFALFIAEIDKKQSMEAPFPVGWVGSHCSIALRINGREISHLNGIEVYHLGEDSGLLDENGQLNPVELDGWEDDYIQFSFFEYTVHPEPVATKSARTFH